VYCKEYKDWLFCIDVVFTAFNNLFFAIIVLEGRGLYERPIRDFGSWLHRCHCHRRQRRPSLRTTQHAHPRDRTPVTAVFTFVEKKEGFFPNFGSTAVSFLLALCPAHMGVTLAFD
jgi:hypothetical protein